MNFHTFRENKRGKNMDKVTAVSVIGYNEKDQRVSIPRKGINVDLEKFLFEYEIDHPSAIKLVITIAQEDRNGRKDG